MLTPQMRANIRARGQEFLARFNALKDELPGLITKVQGTGLLFSCELAPQFKCYGAGSTEEWLRLHGIGVIHGGANSLRYTPHFNVNSGEIELIVAHLRRALLEGPRLQQPAGARAAA
jgi:acetylornithine/succinyldiaminopimelate/putrescine aminotransferase